MSHWKSIARGVATALAMSIITVSTLDHSRSYTGSLDQAVTAGLTFVAVVVLHWLLWRYIVPSRTSRPAVAKPVASPGSDQASSTNLIFFGYLHVAAYCLLPCSTIERPQIEPVLFTLGVFWIGFGTAIRLRDTFARLSSSQVSSVSPPVHAFPGSDDRL